MSFSFQTPGYEHLELSTQILIADALERGVNVEILDPASQFVRLKKGDHVEYVESATKTSRDSYVTSVILGNKVVTKMLLHEQGIRVPEGKHYSHYNEALADIRSFDPAKSWVVKPKLTNYGIGISILQKDFSNGDFSEALANAFKFDSTVLVEGFIAGLECRFLVIDGKCVAVLHRIPANVAGDGKSSIAQLVDKKNNSPLRGKGHTTPLEKIELGETELGVLREQQLSSLNVPQKDQQVFLRHNSNISTGGDSIDFTDSVHEDYKRIAERATEAAGAKICGVDIISNSFEKSADSSTYAVLELNYNPVLYFHNYPYQGKNRDVGKYVLDLLGF